MQYGGELWKGSGFPASVLRCRSLCLSQPFRLPVVLWCHCLELQTSKLRLQTCTGQVVRAFVGVGTSAVASRLRRTFRVGKRGAVSP